MSDSQPPMSLELVPTTRRLTMRRHSVAVTRRPVVVGLHRPVGLGSLREPCGGGGLFFFSSSWGDERWGWRIRYDGGVSGEW